MTTEKNCIKYDRSSLEQLKLFVNFCRQHPELQAGKNNPRETRRTQLLWKELAQGLNSLNDPTRTADKWKETLGNWKNHLRTQTGRIKMDQRLTGGGPSTSRALSEFKELALERFGRAAVDGVEGINALGVARPAFTVDVPNVSNAIASHSELCQWLVHHQSHFLSALSLWRRLPQNQ